MSAEVIDMTASDTAAEPVRDMRRRAVRVRAGSLRAALKDVLGAVAGRAEIPILNHVVLTAGDQEVGGMLSLEATDLDIWITRRLCSNDRDGPGSAEWVQSVRGFSVALPARPLDKILSGIDADAMVVIAVEKEDGEPDDLTDTYAGFVTVSAGRARFRLACLPPAEFPRPTSTCTDLVFDIGCGVLADALMRVSHAVSSDETRYYLNGVLVHVWQEPGAASDLRFAATDGHRLARFSLGGVPDGAMTWPATILHRKTVVLLEKLLTAAVKTGGDNEAAPEVAVGRAERGGWGLVRFAMDAADGGEVDLIAKSIDGTFPDYGRVIPARVDREARVPRAVLAEAAKRIAALTEDKTRAIALSLDTDALTLRANVPGLGSAEETIACTYDAETSTIGLNADYLRTVLGAIGADDVVLGFMNDVAGPVTVRASMSDGDEPRLVQVLMPVRI